ncbi:MAG: hypothetical protein Q7T89_16455, partial [Anaerolineales bacterium]|nr:hypothetical protein [Anaerolineales bacterium]
PDCGCSSGVMVRANSTFTSGYMFVYSEDYSDFSIWKYVNGSTTALQYWTYSPSIEYGWNTLKVVADGSYLDFYINGNLVWSGSDTTFTRGLVGLRMYRGASIERMSVDWATLDLIGLLTRSQADPVESGQTVIPFDPNAPYGPERSPK